MPRKPAILELTGGKSRRQRVWEAIRRLAATGDGYLTVERISRASKVEIDPVRYALKGLIAAGYLQLAPGIAAGRIGVNLIYTLAQDNGAECPRVRPDGQPIALGRGTEAMWAAATALDSFDHHFLAEIAQVRPSTARTYCGLLARAGYFQLLKPGKGLGRGGTAATYRVAAEHADKPRAPMITRLKAVYDPNVHQIVWSEGADDAAEAPESEAWEDL